MRLRPVLLAAAAPLCAAAGVIAYATVARSADHQDSPATIAAASADINDVYTWMNGNNVVLAMTVYPNAPMGTMFDPAVQYVFHTASGNGLLTTASPVDIIATFDASQNVQLWVGNNEYVTGNATDPANPLVSADSKVTVFTGLRADPFFFNLDGFKNTAATVTAVAGTLMLNDAGCPTVNAPTAALLASDLSHAPDGGAPVDHFATFNGLAIVLSVDKTLLTAGGTVVSVWAGTYM
jgi:hypothetical protein